MAFSWPRWTWNVPAISSSDKDSLCLLTSSMNCLYQLLVGLVVVGHLLQRVFIHPCERDDLYFYQTYCIHIVHKRTISRGALRPDKSGVVIVSLRKMSDKIHTSLALKGLSPVFKVGMVLHNPIHTRRFAVLVSTSYTSRHLNLSMW